MVTLCILIFFKGRYVSFGRFMQAHLPFFILLAIVAAIGFGTSSAASSRKRR